MAGFVDKDSPFGTKPKVNITQYAFDRGATESEEDLLSILDNESVHATFHHKQEFPFPRLKVRRNDANAILDLAKRASDPRFENLKAVLHEYQSSLHQIVMIETGRRVVSEQMREHAMDAYERNRELLEEKTRTKSYRQGVDILLKYTSLEEIKAGNVTLRF